MQMIANHFYSVLLRSRISRYPRW